MSIEVNSLIVSDSQCNIHSLGYFCDFEAMPQLKPYNYIYSSIGHDVRNSNGFHVRPRGSKISSPLLHQLTYWIQALLRFFLVYLGVHLPLKGFVLNYRQVRQETPHNCDRPWIHQGPNPTKLDKLWGLWAFQAVCRQFLHCDWQLFDC